MITDNVIGYCYDSNVYYNHIYNYNHLVNIIKNHVVPKLLLNYKNQV